MDEIVDEINQDRRRFFATAAMAIHRVIPDRARRARARATMGTVASDSALE